MPRPRGSVSDDQKRACDWRDVVVNFLKDHIGGDVVFTGNSHGELDAVGPDDTETAARRKATVRIFTFKDEQPL